MRDSDDAEVEARLGARARGLVPRQFVWVTARSRSGGDPKGFGFWTGALPVTVAVLGGETGEEVSHEYQGDGAVIAVSKITLTTGLKIRTATVTLSQIHPAVKEMVWTYDVRLARVEIHRGLLDATTHLLVSPPRCRFLGAVNSSAIKTPAVGEEGSVTLGCNSDTVQLTRTNPLKRSDESQKRRGGDRMNQYADVVARWQMSWGEAEEQ